VAGQVPALRHGAPADTRFAFLRHLLASPMHLVVMGAVMIALMAAAMMMLRWPWFDNECLAAG
jgi:hypothetical protein